MKKQFMLYAFLFSLCLPLVIVGQEKSNYTKNTKKSLAVFFEEKKYFFDVFDVETHDLDFKPLLVNRLRVRVEYPEDLSLLPDYGDRLKPFILHVGLPFDRIKKIEFNKGTAVVRGYQPRDIVILRNLRRGKYDCFFMRETKEN